MFNNEKRLQIKKIQIFYYFDNKTGQEPKLRNQNIFISSAKTYDLRDIKSLSKYNKHCVNCHFSNT